MQPTALVTGGSRGIGSHVTRALAAAGFRVAVAGRNEADVRRSAAAVDGIPLVGDVSHQADVEGWVERVAPLELLVNNAGIGSNASFDSDLDDFRRTIDVNVFGVYMCTQLFLPGMRAAGRGRVVTLSSSAAFMPNPPGELSIAYCCSKAAAARLTEIVADREHTHGVRAFAVSPGGVVTGLSERLGLRFDDPTPPSRVSELIVRIAAGDLDHLSGRYLHANDDITELIDRGPQIVEDDLHAIRLLT